jgi:serralysin
MTEADALERYMLELINQERAKYGLNPVQLELNLNQSAEDHSLWMFEENTFSHTGVNGSSSRDRMIAAGFDFQAQWPFYARSAENIGFQTLRGDPGLLDDVLDIHNRLMASSDHRTTILNPEYQYVGLGIEIGYYGSAYGMMITQNFASTQGDVDLDTGAGAPPVDDGPLPIDGTSGADRLLGTVDDELLRGMGGNDRLIARGGDDTMEGGAGADLMLGGAGGDHHDGGAGFDTASYLPASAGVVADLLNTSVNRGQAAGDTFDSIEALIGSRHGDTLNGDTNDNRLIGHDGDDDLDGRGGRDTLVGGNGDDTLDGGWSARPKTDAQECSPKSGIFVERLMVTPLATHDHVGVLLDEEVRDLLLGGIDRGVTRGDVERVEAGLNGPSFSRTQSTSA